MPLSVWASCHDMLFGGPLSARPWLQRAGVHRRLFFPSDHQWGTYLERQPGNLEERRVPVCIRGDWETPAGGGGEVGVRRGRAGCLDVLLRGFIESRLAGVTYATQRDGYECEGACLPRETNLSQSWHRSGWPSAPRLLQYLQL